MSIDLVVATRNKKKLAEIKGLLSDYNVMSVGDFPNIREVEEDGATFEENAIKKAVCVAQETKHLAIADDSGLEIDYLGGQPGVYSSRFAGVNATDEDRNRKVLDLMKGVPKHDRTARFRCAIAIADPDARVEIANGTCEGEIAFAPRGSSGFGYDPIFIVPAYGKTFAELGSEKKNQISHRALALEKAKELLLKRFSGKS